MDDTKLDLSVLAADPVKWQAMIDATTARLDETLGQAEALRDDPFATIAGWARPLLFAAAAALAVIIPLEVALELRESRAEGARRLAQESASWVAADRTPSGNEILRAIASGAEQ